MGAGGSPAQPREGERGEDSTRSAEPDDRGRLQRRTDESQVRPGQGSLDAPLVVILPTPVPGPLHRLDQGLQVLVQLLRLRHQIGNGAVQELLADAGFVEPRRSPKSGQ